MLVRILVSAALVGMLAACRPSVDSRLVGRWSARTADDVGEIAFHQDHTFLSWERALTYSHQPPVLWEKGEWNINDNKLVLNFRGDTHPADGRHIEFALTMGDENHFIMRQPDGLETTLERLK